MNKDSVKRTGGFRQLAPAVTLPPICRFEQPKSHFGGTPEAPSDLRTISRKLLNLEIYRYTHRAVSRAYIYPKCTFRGSEVRQSATLGAQTGNLAEAIFRLFT